VVGRGAIDIGRDVCAEVLMFEPRAGSNAM
jgi:hypothetical protein